MYNEHEWSLQVVGFCLLVQAEPIELRVVGRDAQALRAAETAGSAGNHAPAAWERPQERPEQRKPAPASPTPHRAPQAPWSLNGGQRHKGPALASGECTVLVGGLARPSATAGVSTYGDGVAEVTQFPGEAVSSGPEGAGACSCGGPGELQERQGRVTALP